MFGEFKGKFGFGDIVTHYSDGTLFIGVVVKSWENVSKSSFNYDVYIRSWNTIKNFDEDEIQKFIYDKEIESEDV